MDHTILIIFLRERSHLSSLLLDFLSVAFALHYCMGRCTPSIKFDFFY